MEYCQWTTTTTTTTTIRVVVTFEARGLVLIPFGAGRGAVVRDVFGWYPGQ